MQRQDRWLLAPAALGLAAACFSAPPASAPPEVRPAVASHVRRAAPPVPIASVEPAPPPEPGLPREEPAAEPAAAKEPPPEGMLLVPAGRFTMGADRGGELDEHPAHAVTVGSFWLDVTEVTNDAYGECVAAGVCRPHDPRNAARNGFDDRAFRRPKQPISGVSWDDAVAYCNFRGKRLPTEAEWERAARGDDERTFPWGDEPPTPEHAVFGGSVTADVGTHPRGAGPYGHLDLAGNVWEWVADMYDPIAYTRPGAAEGKPGSCPEILRALDELRRGHRDGFTGTNPIPTECERVLRGGAFNYPGRGLRVTNRVHHPGRFRLVMSGFRCARDVAPKRSD